MSDRTTVIAGRCTTTYDGAETDREQRGDAVVVCKPDGTVLVHDAAGYQPTAWLTRADRVALEDDRVTAWDGDAILEVTIHDRYGGGQYPVGRAGTPVGQCRDCDGTLVRTNRTVACLDCDARFGVPSDATMAGDACPDCGLPRVSIARGQVFTVCLDPRCESLDQLVADAYDRAWDCPGCGDDLRVLRRGGLILGCASYPACEVSLSVPAGEVVEECDCGLAVFETASGRRCLDPDCGHDVVEDTAGGHRESETGDGEQPAGERPQGL